MLHVEKRHFVMEDVLVLQKRLVLFTETKRSQAWPPIRFAQRANRDAKATGTSEVSTHRISKAKNSLPGWTGSPKWARRRETLGSSIALLKSSVRIIGSKHDDGDAISSGSALRGCTRFRVCVNGSRWGCASRVCEESRGSSRR